jgi:hypothetical protein
MAQDSLSEKVDNRRSCVGWLTVPQNQIERTVPDVRAVDVSFREKTCRLHVAGVACSARGGERDNAAHRCQQGKVFAVGTIMEDLRFLSAS